MPLNLSTSSSLPRDAERATLVGRLWQPGVGPVLVGVHDGSLYDLSKIAPTMSDLLESKGSPPEAVRRALQGAPRIASLDEAIANSDESVRDAAKPWKIGRAHV